jgi:hypothetical protein
MVRSMESAATPVTFLSLLTLLPSVQTSSPLRPRLRLFRSAHCLLVVFSTQNRISAVCFDYASAIDIVSGADARGWPTNHLRNCHHCDVAAVRERAH